MRNLASAIGRCLHEWYEYAILFIIGAVIVAVFSTQTGCLRIDHVDILPNVRWSIERPPPDFVLPDEPNPIPGDPLDDVIRQMLSREPRTSKESK